MGEVGCDTGGLKREFFRLLTRSLSETYLFTTGSFMHNSVALQVHELYCKTCVMLTIIKEFLVDKIYPHRMMYTDDLVSLWLHRWFKEAQDYTSSTLVCTNTCVDLI